MKCYCGVPMSSRQQAVTFLLWCSTLISFGHAAVALATDGEKIRLLIVTGYDHPAHDWKASALALAEVLRADPRFDARIIEDPQQLAAPEAARYDVLMLDFMNWQRPGPGEDAREQLRRLIDGGKGLVLIHFASGAFADWPEYRQLAGRVWDGKNGHDPRGPFRVEIRDQQHPITRGLTSYETDDELYIGLTGERPIVTLASARSKITGQDHPMAFCFEYGRGRVFHTSLGHDARAIRIAGTAELIRRGSAWAARRDSVVEKLDRR